jgi:hypothetical protein
VRIVGRDIEGGGVPLLHRRERYLRARGSGSQRKRGTCSRVLMQAAAVMDPADLRFEPLAVIAHHHHDGVLEVDQLQHPVQQGIGEPDARVVLGHDLLQHAGRLDLGRRDRQMFGPSGNRRRRGGPAGPSQSSAFR